tara:strand:- start:1371 stop:1829 length:459 start_codon:yes stop_codon:yes gene_type:complete
MKQIRSQLDKIIELLLVSILSAMVINVLWQIITRYFSASPSSFSDELARYLMIWLGLIGSAYVSGKKEHVSIDYFLKKLNHKKRVLLNRLIDFIILFFAFFVMIIGGGHLVFVTIKLEQLSPSLQIPLGFVYSVIPLSGLIIIFYQISNIKK